MTDKTRDGIAPVTNELEDGFDSMEDAAIARELRDSYQDVKLSDEAKACMLAALEEAAVADGSESAAPDAPDAPETQQPTGAEAGGAPSPASRKRPMRAWKVALPIAACLVVAAICVVGVSASNVSPAELAGEPSSTSSEPANASAKADDSSSAQSTVEEYALKGEEEFEQYDAAAPEAGLGMYAMDDGAYYGAYAPYEDFNTEEYGAIQETGFVSTATSPLSTVSADVDTASYCNLRRMINGGLSELPSGSVRIEEMLNYFTYDYATPAAGQDFATTVQIAPCPWNGDTQLMTLGFAAAPEDVAASKGSNLVFLIDVSGSMSGNDRLGLLQDSFAVLTDQLDANDTVSIVTYSGQEEVVLDGANGADAREIQRAVDSLVASGSTNGEAGLRMAYDLAEKHYIDGGVNRVIMASDGDLNVGMTSESDLYDFVDGKRETGVYLSVLGFGEGNYKDNKMETLADHGNGNYHYIDCIDEAEKVFGSDLMANIVPFADDVKVQVEFNPANVKAYRLIGYENRALADEDFLDDTVDAGDVGPGAQFTVAYEVALADSALEVDVPELKYGGGSGADTGNASASAASAAAGEAERYDGADAGSFADELLTCSLRYHAFADDQVHQAEAVVHSGDITDAPSNDWTFAASVIEFGMALRGSDYAGTSDMESALDLIAGQDLSDERAGYETLLKRAIRNNARTQDAEPTDPSDPVEVVDGNGLA